MRNHVSFLIAGLIKTFSANFALKRFFSCVCSFMVCKICSCRANLRTKATLVLPYLVTSRWIWNRKHDEANSKCFCGEVQTWTINKSKRKVDVFSFSYTLYFKDNSEQHALLLRWLLLHQSKWDQLTKTY